MAANNAEYLSGHSSTDIEANFTCEDIEAEETADSDSNSVVMSVILAGGLLSVAYYDVFLSELYVMNEIAENDEYLCIKKVISKVRPTMIMTSNRCDTRLMRVLMSSNVQITTGTSINERNTPVELLPNSELLYETCRRALLQCHYVGFSKLQSDQDRFVHLSSVLPMNSVNVVRAVGGLVKFMEKRRTGMELEHTNKVPILAIRTFVTEDIMVIDEATYSALQIFQPENHPSAYKNSCKEGLSLYGVMNRCRTQLGAKTLRFVLSVDRSCSDEQRAWFQCPLRKAVALRDRQAAVSLLVSDRSVELVSTLQSCVRHINNVSSVLHRMMVSEVSLNGWKSFYKTVYNAVCLANVCRTHADVTADIGIFDKIRDSFTESLRQIAADIDTMIDFEAFAVEKRFSVKHGFDSALDEKRQLYASLPDLLTKVAREEFTRLPPNIARCQVVYLPLVGYLLATPLTDSMKDTSKYHIDGLEFMFVTDDTAYYKTPGTNALNSLLGDIKSEINDMQTLWMHTLQDRILEHVDLLLNMLRCAAELDCVMSMATIAKENNYVRPQLTDDNVIDIQGGRHPLQELCCNLFIPNDTHSSDDDTKMKVLTGPNASGKSIYLKQVGLIVFMARIGSFVPAVSATIGPVDGIYTRIHSVDSSSVPLSTFALDLNQVSVAVKCATAHSLVLLDEFGKGTEAVDGLALLCATLRQWLRRDTQCPHVFVSTHFHRLVTGDLLSSPQLKCQTMDTVHGDNDEDLVFLYQLRDGVASSSYALHTAIKAGLSPAIVQRAREVTELVRWGRPLTRASSATTGQNMDRCRAIVEQFLKLDMENDDLNNFLQNTVLPIYQGVTSH